MYIIIARFQKSLLCKNIFDYALKLRIKSEFRNNDLMNPESTSFDEKFKRESKIQVVKNYETSRGT